MARVITQETFDQAVQENIDDLELPPLEAVAAAVEQFQSQGVDLSNIVMNKLSEGQQRPVVLTVQNIARLLQDSSPINILDLVADLNTLKSECDIGLAQRVLAGKEGAYNVLLDTLHRYSSDELVMSAGLSAFTSLMTGNPDLLTLAGVTLMLTLLDTQRNELQVLRWARQCCIKHEANRQMLVNADIVPRLKVLLAKPDTTPAVVRCTCSLIRALVLDDDVRVEFGKAHEHARLIALEMLSLVTGLLIKHLADPETVGELMHTLASLVVKDELCEEVAASGGLDFIANVLIEFQDNMKLVKQSMKLLKALAGNDVVKKRVEDTQCPALTVAAMNRHQGNIEVATACIASVAALTLRSPNNSKLFYDAGAADAIVQIMKIHPNSSAVQKQCSWAVRNMVSRERSLCAGFLALGVEELLVAALDKHKATCDYDVKAALRDLGCEVELKERWTGKGGKLNTQGDRV